MANIGKFVSTELLAQKYNKSGDVSTMLARASSYYAIGLMDRVDFTIVASAHVRDSETFRNVAFLLLCIKYSTWPSFLVH